ncbi:hypothetical protein EV421DRAFT_1743827 [Armillaria borealis]|uniref:Uncharacterized protein n=1 Tax=Armillaria borealis TaxID=47425 RepID=A0AA39IVK1_9AGAR|nr:hypothetical protein EV421DRAFT_1743827 [Armillaria borealis]
MTIAVVPLSKSIAHISGKTMFPRYATSRKKDERTNLAATRPAFGRLKWKDSSKFKEACTEKLQGCERLKTCIIVVTAVTNGVSFTNRIPGRMPVSTYSRYLSQQHRCDIGQYMRSRAYRDYTATPLKPAILGRVALRVEAFPGSRRSLLSYVAVNYHGLYWGLTFRRLSILVAFSGLRGFARMESQPDGTWPYPQNVQIYTAHCDQPRTFLARYQYNNEILAPRYLFILFGI